MDSLPTGSTQSWLIIAAVGLSPILVFFIVGIIGRVLRRKWRQRQPGDRARTAEGEQGQLRVQAPPG